MRRALALLLLVLLATPAAAWQTERVVLVIIDGLRYSEGLGDPTRAHVPQMAALAAQGALVETCLNMGVTYTDHAVPAIWCGGYTDIVEFVDPDCGGADNNITTLPTVFEYFRKQLDKAPEDCIYVLKNVGCPWRGSLHPAYGPDWWPLYDMSGYTDAAVWTETQAVLASESPELLLVYLADVDHYGHAGVWADYLEAIETADAIVGALWTRLQELPDYAGKTTLIVTNDHGRHTTNWTGHGDSCAGCRRVQLLAIGPDTPAGLVSSVQREIIDVAPSIGLLLGFSTEYATGTAMSELFPGSGVDPVPADAGLAAWPNPFRAATTLRFAAPTGAARAIAIYDLAGRCVDRLALPADAAALTWTPPTELASGVYFARVEGGEAPLTRSLVLLR